MSKLIEQLVPVLATEMMRRQLRLVTAESCTGGGLGYALTQVAGSSCWYERGFITYSNLSKIELLGVGPAIIHQFGSVSKQTAMAMAEGALRHSQADMSLSITGIAGPDGGSDEKPVGTVWIACVRAGREPIVERFIFSGDRQAIREAAIEQALRILISL